MHIPSERIYNQMRSEYASLWYVPAVGDGELAFLIKAPTSSIKALVAGCDLKLSYGFKDNYLCIGARIMDMPGTPLFMSGVQCIDEEHNALIKALKIHEFPVFLFNEMDICVAQSSIHLAPKGANQVLNSLGARSDWYRGHFSEEASYALDCFCNSIENTDRYPHAPNIPVIELECTLETWQANNISFVGMNEYHTVTINDKNEGETFEKTIWAALESVFPLTLYKSPQVQVGLKLRELTDVFAHYTYGSFMIEAKDLSVIQAGFERDQVRKTAGIQKQVHKAIRQLIGAAKSYAHGNAIFSNQGEELQVDRTQPPHCIILITELMCCGDWGEIETQIFSAMKETGAFFHLLDLRELIVLLKASSGKPELVDYNLLQRCKLCVEKKSVFIRGQLKA